MVINPPLSTHTGEWWTPEDPDTKWTGTLTLDQSEGALLTVPESTQATSFYPTTRQYGYIHGRTTSGNDITLLRCFDRFVGGALDAPGAREVFANAAIVGLHLQGSDPLVSGASAVFQHANAWWGQSGLKIDRAVAFPDARVDYKNVPPLTLWADGESTISVYATLASLPSGTEDDGSFLLREEVRIELRTKTPRPLSEVNATMHACGDLLSIACQRYCSTERLTIIDAMDGEGRSGTHHAIPIRKPGGRNRSPLGAELLFRFDDIKDRPGEAFCGWLTNAEGLTPVRALFFLALYGENFIEGRFLALVQAAESFHRRFRGGAYLPAAEYEQKVIRPLLASLPSNIDSSLRQSLQNRIKYGSEYSLRKRLTLLFREHREALEAVVPNPLALIDPIVTLRNSLTHLPPGGEGTEDSEGWLRYNFVLRMLLECCFLKTMGFSDHEIRDLARRCPTYRGWSSRLFGAAR